MEPRISIITLGVDDLGRAIAFYRDRLGLPTDGPTGDICFFKLHGAWLSLYPRDLLAEDGGVEIAGGWGGITIAHNVRDKESVDAIITLAEEGGAEITDRPHDREWGGYSGYFRDLDGHLWEVCWNPYFPIA
jgi:catechol 2,3-dioxygenase-like lactoylglutathione lyase family enzyme